VPIHNISIENFRILSDIHISFCSDINIFYGLNGSGKTSILECLFFLSRGKSFNQRQINKLISISSDNFLIYSVIDNKRIGIKKDFNSKLLIKYDNKFITSSFILSKNLTMQIVQPDSYLLIESGPSIRRKFIDWIVFHVKHNLYDKWRRYKLILKQRNIGLKSKLNINEIMAWDHELIQLTNLFTTERIYFINKLNTKLTQYKNEYLSGMDLFIEYYPGWNNMSDYKSVLDENFERDCKYGFSQYGLHKSDLKLKIIIDKQSFYIKDVLSNGLKKYISMFLYILQIELFFDTKEIIISKPVLLIDDITSELDTNYSNLILKFISKFDIQIFFTLLEGSDNNVLIKQFSKNNLKKIKLFHVKHGKISD